MHTMCYQYIYIMNYLILLCFNFGITEKTIRQVYTHDFEYNCIIVIIIPIA